MTYCENFLCFPCLFCIHLSSYCLRVYCCCEKPEIEPQSQPELL